MPGIPTYISKGLDMEHVLTWCRANYPDWPTMVQDYGGSEAKAVIGQLEYGQSLLRAVQGVEEALRHV